MTKIEMPPESQFVTQAQMHLDIQNTLQDLITRFNVQHDTIVGKLDPKQTAQFSQWWSNLSKCLHEHAYLHEQLASHLKSAGESFYQLDEDIANSLKPEP